MGERGGGLREGGFDKNGALCISYQLFAGLLSYFLSPCRILQFIFSTAIDGKIKAWLYDCLGSRVDYDAPGHWCTTMAYSADGTRFIFPLSRSSQYI